MKTLQTLIKTKRKELKLTYNQLSDLTSINRVTLINWETGKSICLSKPNIDKLIDSGIFLREELESLSRVNFYKRKKRICSITNCGKDHTGLGYCVRHLAQFKRHGRILSDDELTPLYRSKDRNGYIRITEPNKPQVMEHRIVMSEFIGRPLLSTETVHHLNGIKDDNRIENLELWVSDHPSGQRLEDKIKWSMDFLTQYGYEVTKK